MTAEQGFICLGGALYRFEGWLIEVHRYHGPWPLRKDLAPRARAGRKFWDAWGRFSELSEKERAVYLVEHGGCIAI